MLTGAYRELFSVIAETAASLTGLLFVAISLAPARDPNSQEALVQQIRAAAAYLAFVDALVISLFGLVPGTNIGYPGVVLGVSGVFFTAACVRSIVGRHLAPRLRNSQIALLLALLLTFGFEIDTAVRLLINRHNTGMLGQMSYLLLAAIVIGVARSWELVGSRQTGLLSSIALLRGHTRPHASVSSPADLDREPPGARLT
jgi:hypothetical protein